MTSPAARSRSRQFLLQALYQAQLTETEYGSVADSFIAEHNMKRADLTYFREVLRGIQLELDELESLISAKLDLFLMKKITYLGVGLVISRTAPTKQALEYAHSHNVSIVGFARGKRFNWYVS